MITGSYPITRMRRRRQFPWLRDLVRETSLSPGDLIWGVIITYKKEGEPNANLPGLRRYSLTELPQLAKKAKSLGISALSLFPNIDPQTKDETGSEALNPDNLVCRAIQTIKASEPGLGVMCDVALDPYTSHGHDGLIENGEVQNDPTIENLARQAVIVARAGCDIIGPSDMMDGRVGVLRTALDSNGYENCLIMSYCAKFASAFYGPYRDAIGSASLLTGDKKTYQMDPANRREALAETALDVKEGADLLLVKPGLAYLDIIANLADRFSQPVFAFQVSGEYAMLRMAADAGYLDEELAMLESLLAFKRAGCCGIITYYADEAAKLLSA